MTKTISLILSALLMHTLVMAQNPTDSTGLAGDGFSLEGAIEIFKRSQNLEAYENALNLEENGVNNLDLNDDGEVDYLRVEDHLEADFHAIVIQALVDEREVQDVAVVCIEKNGTESAVLQIIGDEELYGEQRIVEPSDERESGGKGGPLMAPFTSQVVVNVWLWPCVRAVYAPGYRVWVSPFFWRKYPMNYRPWRIHPWHWHWNQCSQYRIYHHTASIHRVKRAHTHYRSYHVGSARVHHRYAAAHQANDARRTKANRPVNNGLGEKHGGSVDRRGNSDSEVNQRQMPPGKAKELDKGKHSARDSGKNEKHKKSSNRQHKK